MVDAALALNRLIPSGSVHDFVALFPPPWPKDRHEKRRLFGTEFMEIAADRLIAGGRFKIVTDDIDYRDWIASGIPDRWYRAESLVIPAGYDTKYERKWMDAGQDRFYQLELTKIDHPDRPPQEDLAVESHRINCFHPDAFTPRDHEGPLTVKFRDWLYDPRREIMAVQVLTVEDRLKQMIWVLIARKDDGWLVSLAHSTQVVPGEAVRLALDLTRRAAEKTVE
jgi:tRNA (guanine-N7-)-methyltransferase